MKMFEQILSLIAGSMLSGAIHAQVLPDPTRPANYSPRAFNVEAAPQKMMDWKVRAIRSSATGRNAVLNDKIVKIGDAIDQATIVDITPDTVIVAYDRKQLVLKLMPEAIKKKRAVEPETKVTK